MEIIWSIRLNIQKRRIKVPVRKHVCVRITFCLLACLCDGGGSRCHETHLAVCVCVYVGGRVCVNSLYGRGN